MPFELFGDLVAHGLFAFEPIGLFQRRDIEPAFGCFLFGDDAAAIIDQAVDQGEIGAVLRDFDLIGHWCIARHEDVSFDAGARA